ncbi:DUF2381 family protein [Hyalangium rubrum]|uniref:DUF2381 family protein n=1 Tax=Hyalangium rubrum TaxID=3103134 RepID=A0ABU5H9W2_9BACT|nr:DUF2381 family protein [Hyalangium sp. s54d21]MDY7230271.1 DUF2381 family protein [Hyalangium sp. s54d21]
MALPTTWPFLALSLLVASTAAAQPQPPARQRQDRRVALPATSAEPIPELYVAAGNLTTVAFNGPLDRESLVVDRTRFKWVDVGDSLLALQPFADLGSGERLIVKVGFKDRALPAQAVLAVVTDSTVVDGNVEMDRRANTPEALLAALTQKEAELEELNARYAGHGPAGLVLSEWLTDETRPIGLVVEASTADASGLEVQRGVGYEGKFSVMVAVRLRNLSSQKPWSLGHARITSATGAPVRLLSVQTKLQHLALGEEGLVVLETKVPPWSGKGCSVELVDADGQRRLSFKLMVK